MEYLLGIFEWRMISCAFLLCLFVANGKADCPTPHDRLNIVLTNEALLKNSFPEGTEVTYACGKGLVREHGSGTITCTSGQWSEPDLTCKKKDCGNPQMNPHMSFKFESEGTLFGAKVQVICEKGYQVRGSAYLRCFANGWYGKAICEVATCEIPGVIAHGRNSWDSEEEPKNGEVIQYFCDEGYTLSGESYIECNEDGQYNSQPPECKGTPNILTTVVNVLPTNSVMTTVTTRATTEAVDHPSDRDQEFVLTEGTIAMDTKITSTTHRHQITTTTSAPPHPMRGEHGEDRTSKGTGNTVVAVSVIGTTIVVLAVVGMFYRSYLRRKGCPKRTAPM